MQDSGCLARLFAAGCGFAFGASAAAVALFAMLALMFGGFSSMLSLATAVVAAGSCALVGGILGSLAMLRTFRTNPWRQYGTTRR